MAESSINRYYPLKDIGFRDFWDICSHFQRVHVESNSVLYTINGVNDYIVLDEPDVAVILRKLSTTKEVITKFVARFYSNESKDDDSYQANELIYQSTSNGDLKVGLYFNGFNLSKLLLYKFENLIYTNYDLDDASELNVEFGKPCEVLTAVIDMRGFSVFCEQPNIESPYICGLMTAFYQMVKKSFFKYPPDLIKFAGDGVLAIWQTTVEDREIAIDVSLQGLVSLNSSWQIVRRSPNFTHGAPDEIGCGISFGLASVLSIGDDYIGRPINIASRLCGVCPGGRVYVDRSLPIKNDIYQKKQTRVRIKSYGEYNVWMVFAE